MPYIFEDDGASFRVRRKRELETRFRVIVQGEGWFKRWLRKSSPIKIFASLVIGGVLFFVAYFILAFGGLILYDALTR